MPVSYISVRGQASIKAYEVLLNSYKWFTIRSGQKDEKDKSYRDYRPGLQ